MGHVDHNHAGHRPGPASGHRPGDHAGGHTGPADHNRGHDHHAGQDGHDHHVGHDPAGFRRRFWLSLALTVPVVLTSPMVAGWFGYEVPGWADGVAPVLGTVVFAYGGAPFLTGAVAEVRARAPGMMLLISMAITVAFVASLASTLGWFALDFWWELSALVTVMLLGHWQETRAIRQARGALGALAALLPDQAERLEPTGDTRQVPVSDLRVGDVVLVRPGGRVPADGRVVQGRAEFDESMITGESTPVVRTVDDRVVAGTVALDSAVRVEVTAVGEGTALAGIHRLVAEAQASRGRGQVLADRFAGWLFYLAVAVALLTFGVWWLLGEPGESVLRAVTVLVIACPHALGLAIPLVVSLTTALSAHRGILIRDRRALERMREVDAVLFDKTGTLTTGAPTVIGVAPAGDRTEAEVLRLAAAVESDSEHPLAQAIVAAADSDQPPVASEFESLPGHGVRATVEGKRYAVGGPALLRRLSATVPADLTDRTTPWRRRGATVLHLLRVDEGQPVVLGALALADQVRPQARAAVEDLRALGVTRIAMITGDARSVAETVATDLGFRSGVDEVYAEVLPADKERIVRELRERGAVVAMVGDGVNDAPALARADVGIAIGAGTEVAIESAELVLGSSDPRGVAAVLRLARASYRKMVQNLAWAVGYNVVALPLAAGVLAGVGVTLSPAVGAVLMSASTIVVALNAQLLRRIRLTPS